MERPSLRALVIALALVAAGAPSAGAAAVPLDLIAPADGPIVRRFEPPPGPYAPGHRGIDLGAPGGSPVVAAAPGTVSFAGAVAGSLHVTVGHDGGYRTTYSFLSAVQVRAGTVVSQGQRLGSTGTGHPGEEQPHLHFGLREGDRYLDPEPVLAASYRRNRWRAIGLAPAP